MFSQNSAHQLGNNQNLPSICQDFTQDLPFLYEDITQKLSSIPQD